MNPRYLNYCRVHGRTPDEQHAHDEVAWPGGRMTGFISWMSQQMRAFHAAHPEAFLGGKFHALFNHETWDRWLDATTTKLED